MDNPFNISYCWSKVEFYQLQRQEAHIGICNYNFYMQSIHMKNNNLSFLYNLKFIAFLIFSNKWFWTNCRSENKYYLSISKFLMCFKNSSNLSHNYFKILLFVIYKPLNETSLKVFSYFRNCSNFNLAKRSLTNYLRNNQT